MPSLSYSAMLNSVVKRYAPAFDICSSNKTNTVPKLSAEHAAAAAGIASSTAYGRIAHAKSNNKIGSNDKFKPITGSDVFKMLVEYADASRTKVCRLSKVTVLSLHVLIFTSKAQRNSGSKSCRNCW